MENQQATAKKFVLNYGVMLGIVSVIYGVILYATNVYLDPSITYGIISYLIVIVLVTLAIKAFKTENGGYLTLSEALKVGIGAAVIGGIIAAVWTFVLTSYIEPDLVNDLMETTREKMIETQPDMSEAQVDAAIGMTSKLSSPPIAFALSLVGSLFFGLIISLIVGLIMKNKNPMEG